MELVGKFFIIINDDHFMMGKIIGKIDPGTFAVEFLPIKKEIRKTASPFIEIYELSEILETNERGKIWRLFHSEKALREYYTWMITDHSSDESEKVFRLVK